MRTRTTAVLFAASALLLVGCGSSDTDGEDKASREASSTPATKSTAPSPSASPAPTAMVIGTPYKWTNPATGETVETSGITNVIGYEQPVSVKNWPAEAVDAENPEWIAVEVKVCNENGDDVTVSQAPWSLGFPDDTRVETTGLIGSGLPKPEYPVDGGTLRPGDCLRGKIPFVVEKGQRPDRVIYQGGGMHPVEWTVPKK